MCVEKPVAMMNFTNSFSRSLENTHTIVANERKRGIFDGYGISSSTVPMTFPLGMKAVNTETTPFIGSTGNKNVAVLLIPRSKWRKKHGQ